MPSRAVANFMKQQGFALEPPDACAIHFRGLYFQPRIVFPTVIVAILLQLASIPLSAGLHLAISAVLWWNTLAPALNPFELAYNRWVARPKGRPGLVPAPGPRRMAQGMAAAINLGAGLALLYGMMRLAWGLQAMLGSIERNVLASPPIGWGCYIHGLSPNVFQKGGIISLWKISFDSEKNISKRFWRQATIAGALGHWASASVSFARPMKSSLSNPVWCA